MLAEVTKLRSVLRSVQLLLYLTLDHCFVPDLDARPSATLEALQYMLQPRCMGLFNISGLIASKDVVVVAKASADFPFQAIVRRMDSVISSTSQCSTSLATPGWAHWLFAMLCPLDRLMSVMADVVMPDRSHS